MSGTKRAHDSSEEHPSPPTLITLPATGSSQQEVNEPVQAGEQQHQQQPGQEQEQQQEQQQQDPAAQQPLEPQPDQAAPDSQQVGLSAQDTPQAPPTLILSLQHPDQLQGASHHRRGLHLGAFLASDTDAQGMAKRQRGGGNNPDSSAWAHRSLQPQPSGSAQPGLPRPSNHNDGGWADSSARPLMGPPQGSGFRADLGLSPPAPGQPGWGGGEPMVVDAVARLPESALQSLLNSEMELRERQAQEQRRQEQRRAQDQHLMAQLLAMQGATDASRLRDREPPPPPSARTVVGTSPQTITVDVATLNQFLQQATGMLGQGQQQQQQQQQRGLQEGPGSGFDQHGNGGGGGGGGGSASRGDKHSNSGNSYSFGGDVARDAHGNGATNHSLTARQQQQLANPAQARTNGNGRSIPQLGGGQDDGRAAGGRAGPSAPNRPPVTHADPNHSRRMVVAKFMTRSDAQTKRLILPRAQLERNMPEVTLAPHHTFTVNDDFGESWSFVIRAWPNGNNPKPVYVLEHISEYVNTYQIGEGDALGLSVGPLGELHIELNTPAVMKHATRPHQVRARVPSSRSGNGSQQQQQQQQYSTNSHDHNSNRSPQQQRGQMQMQMQQQLQQLGDQQQFQQAGMHNPSLHMLLQQQLQQFQMQQHNQQFGNGNNNGNHNIIHNNNNSNNNNNNSNNNSNNHNNNHNNNNTTTNNNNHGNNNGGNNNNNNNTDNSFQLHMNQQAQQQSQQNDGRGTLVRGGQARSLHSRFNNFGGGSNDGAGASLTSGSHMGLSHLDQLPASAAQALQAAGFRPASAATLAGVDRRLPLSSGPKIESGSQTVSEGSKGGCGRGRGREQRGWTGGAMDTDVTCQQQQQQQQQERQQQQQQRGQTHPVSRSRSMSSQATESHRPSHSQSRNRPAGTTSATLYELQQQLLQPDDGDNNGGTNDASSSASLVAITANAVSNSSRRAAQKAAAAAAAATQTPPATSCLRACPLHRARMLVPLGQRMAGQ
ncbi:MAG: hypothetical protein WDW36_009393 [Sanguina aurantia]